MKTRTSAFFFPAVLALVALLATGCPVNLEFPLIQPEHAETDKLLYGTWITADEGAEVQEVTIREGEDKALDIHVDKAGNAYTEETYEYKGFITQLGGKKILFCKALSEDSKGYYYYTYEIVKKKTLIVREVSDKPFENATFASQGELVAFFSEHLHDEGFLMDPITYKKQ